MADNAIQTIVVDEGSSQVKMAWIENGTIKTFLMPTRAKYGADENYEGEILPSAYEIEGMTMTISSKIADPIRTKSEHYQTGLINRAVTHEALRLAGFGGQTINLVATLPAEQFFEGQHVREAKRDHLLQPVTNLGGAALANINAVSIAPEGVMAWNSLCLDDNGRFLEDYDDVEKVMIVDIGGTTTDITIVHNDNHVEDKRSVDIGVFTIANKLNDLIRKSTEIDGSRPSASALDTALRTGLFRKKWYVRALVDKSASVVAGQLSSEMFAMLNDPGDLDFVCYVGGGSYLLKDDLSRCYKGSTTREHPAPEFAVALGILKGILESQLDETPA